MAGSFAATVEARGRQGGSCPAGYRKTFAEGGSRLALHEPNRNSRCLWQNGRYQ